MNPRSRRRAPAVPAEVFLTRRVAFCAAHRLHSEVLTARENVRVFGICNNKNGHGHNYALEVTVRGAVDPRTGMVMNLRDLKHAIERRIVAECDHKNLNLDVPWLRGINPTAENLALAFWRRLEGRVQPGQLHCVRLYESEDNVVEVGAPPT